MPQASKQTASQTESMEGFEGHYEHFDGGYTVGFESYGADLDAAPMFQGLPDDRCQCEHWGYVLNGKIGFRYADHEETYEAGEAYYAPPGHTPILYAGGEVVEFSPTGKLNQTMQVVAKNMEAASASA
jgi:hypothetical protein